MKISLAQHFAEVQEELVAAFEDDQKVLNSYQCFCKALQDKRWSEEEVHRVLAGLSYLVEKGGDRRVDVICGLSTARLRLTSDRRCDGDRVISQLIYRVADENDMSLLFGGCVREIVKAKKMLWS